MDGDAAHRKEGCEEPANKDLDNQIKLREHIKD
jgi:hypothetical protein